MPKKALILLLLIVALGVALGYLLFNRNRAPGSAAPGPVVARVGKAVLTQEELRNRIPPEYTDFITREQNEDYVKRWIDTEILFQAALDRKLDQDPEVRGRLQKMHRDLLVSEMIGRLSSQVADVTDSDIEKYYRDNVDRFTRRETEVQYLHLNVKTLPEAWKVRSQLTPDNFIGTAKQVSLDPVADPASLPYLSRNEIMPELADIVFEAKVGGITPPIKTPFGFYLVKVVDKRVPGTIKPLESVREEIVNHLSSANQKIRLDEMIGQMRKNVLVECYADRIPGRAAPKQDPPDSAVKAAPPPAPDVKKPPVPPASGVKASPPKVAAPPPAPAAASPAVPPPAPPPKASPASAAPAVPAPAPAAPAPAPGAPPSSAPGVP